MAASMMKRASSSVVPLPLSMDDSVLMIPVSADKLAAKKEKKAAEIPLWVEEVSKWAPFKKNKLQLPLLTVQWVLAWVFFTFFDAAAAMCILFAIAAATCSPCQSCWISQSPVLTPAQDVEMRSFAEGFLWSTVLQAATATAGLLLPRRRASSRWWLALVAVVSAAVAHYMHTRSVLVNIAADPENIFFAIVAGGGAFVFVAGDLFSILSLLIGGTE
ncbi:hypothetical protein EJB05_29610 [Eragrostis curvula]|uniref:Uncharacterized protein n=1 Tax=Eragrostis curvula TaxID=38414 RepID=A0A5J9SKS5_9POAL|nr:hypothetical protein EJB05_55044 [Eragrostis curvula]TVU27032.1 hypothetical protein EJB05_29610 [Eragrostis curvula]